ncbi:hypothetical protein [Microbacterium lacticum]
MNERLQARVDKIKAEIARREASRSTSERQAEYVLRANRREEPAEDRDVERERTWGDDGERRELPGDVSSRRQAARLTRGRSS